MPNRVKRNFTYKVDIFAFFREFVAYFFFAKFLMVFVSFSKFYFAKCCAEKFVKYERKFLGNFAFFS